MTWHNLPCAPTLAAFSEACPLGWAEVLVMRNAERQAVADNNAAEACFCGIAALAKGTGAP